MFGLCFYVNNSFYFFILTSVTLSLSLLIPIISKRSAYYVASANPLRYELIKIGVIYALAIGITWTLILYLIYRQIELNEKFIESLLLTNIILIIRFSLSFLKYTLSLWCLYTENDFRIKFALFPLMKNLCIVLSLLIIVIKFFSLYIVASAGTYYIYFIRLVLYSRKYWTNKSLKLKVEKLPVVTYINSNEVCIICLQRIQRGKELLCKHVFHIHCLEYPLLSPIEFGLGIRINVQCAEQI